jgi:hypothetical protein
MDAEAGRENGRYNENKGTSGAILITFVPFPRQNDFRPPSRTISCTQCHIPVTRTPVFGMAGCAPCACKRVFSRSNGAVAVLDTAPAIPPASS